MNRCVKEEGRQFCESVPVQGSPACTLAEGGDGICRAGQCVAAGCGNAIVEDGEECDDGNDDEGDGCRNDCTFTCKVNADCNDGNACNGFETCDTTTHTCRAGTPVTCSSAKAGCTGACEPSTGACIWADLDGDGLGCDVDCNDADPAIYPGAFECRDGKDNDCNPSTPDATAPSCVCYRDSDGDGYAPLNAPSVSAVSCPANHTRREPKASDPSTVDCYDGVASANPGQTGWFDKSYCTFWSFIIDTGERWCSRESYDYNCDGVQEKRFNTAGIAKNCFLVTTGGLYSCGGTGWLGSVPACGQTGTYRSCTLFRPKGANQPVCISSVAERTQECR